MTPPPSLPPDNPTLRRFLREVWAKEQRTSWVRYVDTQSMTPSLYGPVDLLVQWGSSHPFQPGDLIAFEHPVLNILVAHRVCRVDSSTGRVLQTGDRLHTRGIPGAWIPLENVFGRVTALRWPASPREVRLSRLGVAWIGRQISRSSARLWSQDHPHPYLVWTHRLWCWAYRFALILLQELPHETHRLLPQN